MISVVIPLYNKETIIEKSLNSVLSQDYSDFELIVVDDGSTDGSVAIVEKIFDNRIHLIRQKTVVLVKHAMWVFNMQKEIGYFFLMQMMKCSQALCVVFQTIFLKHLKQICL